MRSEDSKGNVDTFKKSWCWCTYLFSNFFLAVKIGRVKYQWN